VRSCIADFGRIAGTEPKEKKSPKTSTQQRYKKKKSESKPHLQRKR
jgi:hypothetical protein